MRRINNSQIIYLGLVNSYNFVERILERERDPKDYPSLYKFAVAATIKARDCKIPKGDLTPDEASSFSNKLEKMLVWLDLM